MKVRITAGDVEVRVDGLDLSKRQLVDLMREATGLAVALTTVAPSDDPPTTGSAIGFTAHLDLDPERNLGEDLSEWFEEAP